jgi:hypothetical protein
MNDLGRNYETGDNNQMPCPIVMGMMVKMYMTCGAVAAGGITAETSNRKRSQKRRWREGNSATASME